MMQESHIDRSRARADVFAAVASGVQLDKFVCVHQCMAVTTYSVTSTGFRLFLTMFDHSFYLKNLYKYKNKKLCLKYYE